MEVAVNQLVNQLLGLAVVTTSFWVLFDAYRLMANVPKPALRTVTKATTSPFVWFIGCLLLWIVAFPWYLIVRGKYKALQGRGKPRR